MRTVGVLMFGAGVLCMWEAWQSHTSLKRTGTSTPPAPIAHATAAIASLKPKTA